MSGIIIEEKHQRRLPVDAFRLGHGDQTHATLKEKR